MLGRAHHDASWLFERSAVVRDDQSREHELGRLRVDLLIETQLVVGAANTARRPEARGRRVAFRGLFARETVRSAATAAARVRLSSDARGGVIARITRTVRALPALLACSRARSLFVRDRIRSYCVTLRRLSAWLMGMSRGAAARMTLAVVREHWAVALRSQFPAALAIATTYNVARPGKRASYVATDRRLPLRGFLFLHQND
jgi:hypothetical protein